MDCSIKKHDDELYIQPIGRLDSNSVPELEKDIPSLDGIDKIVFDFGKVEYISSIGLRFVLRCKKNVNDTKITNCSNEVFEIFNMTGFAEMMDVYGFEKEEIDFCIKYLAETAEKLDTLAY